MATHPPEVGERSWAYLFEGGKQVRPRLFCDLWNYLCPEREPCGEYAFALECVHVASLILDDLPWMDNAEERRGYPTLHRQFTPRKALLLCHDILRMAYHLVQGVPGTSVYASEVEAMILQKLKRLTAGQVLDLERQGTRWELAALKTGTLFEWVTEAVALCLGLDRVFWRRWGNLLGVLFQWRDDWSDREEDALHGQRNAFLEHPEETLVAYRAGWRHLVQGVGTGWFRRPFGAFLRDYFRPPLSLEDEEESLTVSLRDLIQPIYSYEEVPLPTLSYERRGSIWLGHLFRALSSESAKTVTSESAKTVTLESAKKKALGLADALELEPPFLKENLWNRPESEWSTCEEIRAWKVSFLEEGVDEMDSDVMESDLD